MRTVLYAPLLFVLMVSGAIGQTPEVPEIDLVKWGAPDATLLRAVMPVGRPADWMSAEDFAILAAPRPQPSGQYEITLTITADDKVSTCHVGWYDGIDISAGLCPILKKKGHFLHGLGEDGSRRSGSLRMLLTYRMKLAGAPFSGTPPVPVPPGWRPYQRIAAPVDNNDLIIKRPIAGTVTPPILHVNVSAEGRMLWCHIYETSGDDAIDLAACRQVNAIHLAPALDADGKPAAMTTLFWTRF